MPVVLASSSSGPGIGGRGSGGSRSGGWSWSWIWPWIEREPIWRLELDLAVETVLLQHGVAELELPFQNSSIRSLSFEC
uniref:Uncharacterized protein n=1 Tax=Fagus sylvatica TaxID=28930 RepID=A0A2N9GYM8_FAGSY